jgi:hypothetical protein
MYILKNTEGTKARRNASARHQYLVIIFIASKKRPTLIRWTLIFWLKIKVFPDSSDAQTDAQTDAQRADIADFYTKPDNNIQQGIETRGGRKPHKYSKKPPFLTKDGFA